MRFRIVVYDDPYYYPYRSYGATRVVFTRPLRPEPRFIFKDRQASDAFVTRVRARPADDDRRREVGVRGRDLGGTSVNPPPEVRPRARPNSDRPTQPEPRARPDQPDHPERPAPAERPDRPERREPPARRPEPAVTAPPSAPRPSPRAEPRREAPPPKSEPRVEPRRDAPKDKPRAEPELKRRKP